jgi:FixJ family two-component response regulator
LLRANGYEAREFSSVAELVPGAIKGGDCMLGDYRIGRGKRRVLDLLAERGIDAPTVLMSGSDLEEVVSENGTQRCLVKPFTKAQLRQAIEAAIGKK